VLWKVNIGVKYDSGLKNETLNMANSPLVERAISELKEEMGEEEEVIKTEDDIEMAEAPMTEEVVEEEPKGLMARREA
jgi:hypothetical protein